MNISEQAVQIFFSSRKNPPAMAISDVAAFLGIDDAVVRRWARNNQVKRVGPNFALTREEIVRLRVSLQDQSSEPEPRCCPCACHQGAAEHPRQG